MPRCTTHKTCISNAVRRAESICRRRGLRFTDLRRCVLELVWQSHKPAKAYAILEQLKGKDYSAQPPTVYRALDFLLAQGFIHKLNSLNAYVGCYFLICSECREVKECCNRLLSSAIAQTAAKNKFSNQRAILEIEGKCAECARRKRR